MVASPRFEERSTRAGVDLLWCTAARVNSRIERVPCGEAQWESDGAGVILEVPRREGVRVPAA